MAPNSGVCQAIVSLSDQVMPPDGRRDSKDCESVRDAQTVSIYVRMFFEMTTRTLDLEVGQRYRNARLSAFGVPLQIVWLLEQVWQGADGITYARLVKDADATAKKTVSAAVLQDRQQFIQVYE